MKRKFSLVVIALFILAVIGSASFILYYSISSEDHMLLPESCAIIDTCQWEAADGSSGTAALPARVPVGGFEPVTYRVVLPDNIRDNEWFCILTHTTMEIRVNGELRLAFDEDAAGISGSIEKSTYHFCPLSSEDSGAVVEITMKSTFSANSLIRPFYLGDSFSIVHYIQRQNVTRYFGIIVLFVLALIGILLGVFFSMERRTPANIIFIGVGILLVSTWLILDDALYPFFFPNVYIDGVTSYLFGVLALFPFMVYVDRLQKGRHHRVYLGLEIADLVYFCSVCLARFAFHCVLSEHLVIYTLPIVLMGIVWLIPIAADIITRKVRDYQLMVYGLILFMALSTLDIVLINLIEDRIDGNLVLLGLYVLSITALFQQLRESRQLFQTLDYQSQQIHAISQKNQDLEIRTRTDALTGLYNRAYLKSAVRKHLSEHPVGALLFFDLDDFKYINDTYGHLEGDRVLIAFARALRKSFRREDIICRLGGDEFVVFMTEAVTEDLVQHKGLLIMDYFRSNPEVAKYAPYLDASFGAAYVPDEGKDFETLFKIADAEMYRQKNIRHRR